MVASGGALAGLPMEPSALHLLAPLGSGWAARGRGREREERRPLLAMPCTGRRVKGGSSQRPAVLVRALERAS